MRSAVLVCVLTLFPACASFPLRSPIPANVREAAQRLEIDLSSDVLSEVRDTRTHEDRAVKFHFSLGLWIRNEWIYPAGSPLHAFFVAQGVEHEDDMSGMVIEVLHAELNDRAWDLQELIACFRSISPPVLERQPDE
ncbi:MAG: hypothetical protein HC882_08050 [Acidobacteria bacterium]|nr:hypothetical protein [Acidobacteriota bacterium]